ncbi:MAG: hypothetical protein EOP84_32755 [Verrucomicrobiaceae bacterium]|nr:MAG: hypothetical protein EOP84_32755 [Verrucomicrobiaceae bacterium]
MSDDAHEPEFYHEIPDDVTPEQRTHMQAQQVINDAFHSFGHPNDLEGTLTISSADVEHVLTIALAMVIATDAGVQTPQEIRRVADFHAKKLRMLLKGMRDTGDRSADTIMAELNMRRSMPN